MINLDLFDQKRFSTRGGERTVQSDLDITEEPVPRPIMGDARPDDTGLSDYPDGESVSISPNLFSASIVTVSVIGVFALLALFGLYKLAVFVFSWLAS